MMRKPTTTQHVRAARRAVFAALLLMCVNFAAQPCLMAMELQSGPGTSSTHAMHSESADSATGIECSHCPPHDSRQQEGCDGSVSADCGALPDFNYDGRTSTLKLKHAPGDLPLAIAPAVVTMSVAERAPALSDIAYSSLRPAHQPPLNLLYCIYLI